MNRFPILHAVLVGLVLTALGARAQQATRTFDLKAGWNSIWLDVTPSDTAIENIFKGLPLESAWSHQSRLGSVDFIQDPGETLWNKDEWLVHVPTNRIESLNNTLFHVTGTRAYILRLTAAAQLSVTGRLSIRSRPWTPNSYNLRGFPVEASAPPTFQDFFRTSPAHSRGPQLEKIYQLDASGEWRLARPTDKIGRGNAYWVFTRGASEFEGPLALQVLTGDGLDYGLQLDEITLTFKNADSTPRAVTLRETGGSSGIPLSIAGLSQSGAIGWSDLVLPYPLTVPARGSANLRLGVRRSALPSNTYSTVVEVVDGAGTSCLLPVSAARLGAGLSPQLQSPNNDAVANAGLWMGVATIKGVNEATAVDRLPKPTRSGFNLRLLIHVDAAGQSRLLKEVIQLWKPGTYTNDVDGNSVVDVPGNYVLITDDRLVPQFQGSDLRDGQLVGRRFSTIGFDFPPASEGNFLPLSGVFAASQIISGSITLDSNFPTNPFKHKYHPDHDNLDARYTGFSAEAYGVVRNIDLEFSPTPVSGGLGPDYGYRVIGGTYRETLRGLHKADLVVQGTFQLKRISGIDVLNQ